MEFIKVYFKVYFFGNLSHFLGFFVLFLGPLRDISSSPEIQSNFSLSLDKLLWTLGGNA
jgi:hypothetical protein